MSWATIRTRSPARRTLPSSSVAGRRARRDLPQALLALLERHDRRARDDLERPDLRKLGDDVLGDAVGEVLVVGIGAEVEERQHGDGRAPAGAPWRRGPAPQRLRDRRIAVGRDASERLPDSPLDTLRHLRPHGPDPRHGVHDFPRLDGLHRGARERRIASQHLVEHATEGVDVAPHIHRFAD